MRENKSLSHVGRHTYAYTHTHLGQDKSIDHSETIEKTKSTKQKYKSYTFLVLEFLFWQGQRFLQKEKND